MLADAFIVEVEAMNPNLVYLRNKQRPFYFALIWNSYNDELTGDKVNCFAIITTTANKFMQELGYKRMPVIQHQEYEIRWVRGSTQLSEVHDMLSLSPFNLMNCYRISTKIAGKAIDDKSIVLHCGNPVYNENGIKKNVKVREKGKQ